MRSAWTRWSSTDAKPWCSGILLEPLTSWICSHSLSGSTDERCFRVHAGCDFRRELADLEDGV